MDNGHIGVLSHLGHLAVETLKAADPSQKQGQNSPPILLNFKITLGRKQDF